MAEFTNYGTKIITELANYTITYSIDSKTYPNLWGESALQPKENSMRGLFDVYVVDPDNDEVVYESNHIIAKNEESAKIKAIQEGKDTLADLDLEQYDLIVVKLGNVSERKTVE